MTTEQYNKFLTLLMGECWHELESKQWVSVSSGFYYTKCKLCGKEFHFGFANPDHLQNPLIVIRWMEKEMPEVWDDYLHWCFQRPRTSSLSDDIFFILDLRNLVDYLWQNQEWGERECYGCIDGIPEQCSEGNKECGGTGMFIHPALKYLKEVYDGAI